MTIEEKFNCFNSDVKLLLINILLEGFYRGQNVFTLDQFIKGDYWKIEEINEEVRDANDYSCAKSLVIHQLFYIIDEFNLGKIKRVSVNDIETILEDVVKQAVMKKDGTEEDVWYYCAIINEITNLERIRIKKMQEKEYKFDPKSFRRIDFASDEFYRCLDLLLSDEPEYIEIEITPFNKENIKKLHEAVDDFIYCFSQDDYIDQKSIYQKNRFYFSKQLENFYEYIKKLPMIDGCINLPFSSLQETDFEVIKVLNFLEKKYLKSEIGTTKICGISNFFQLP